jgi:hypothetical protein
MNKPALRCGYICQLYGGVMRDTDGCTLPDKHKGPHEFRDSESGRRYQWEYDDENDEDVYWEVSNMPKLYFLQAVHVGYVGNSPMFWHKDDSGYTPWLDDAKQMTADEAETIMRTTKGTHRWQPWSVEDLSSIAKRTVDIQDMRNISP